MNKFNSQSEAIKACNTECVMSWDEYCIAHNILQADNPHAFNVAKELFYTGFMSGAKFVSDYIVGQMPPDFIPPNTSSAIPIISP